ncbi:hypothetical protein [Yinghuangia soli]|uniref:Uncharacterized protein n=1 Tax=Yinghuangia soli TaxID=2908204 RepID=A0AA41QBQ5_9ACTN|nr:hypothetical protein [Yinghuangia soli]MCF2533949.1 hypothetical protein [Yinghuangia soli]
MPDPISAATAAAAKIASSAMAPKFGVSSVIRVGRPEERRDAYLHLGESVLIYAFEQSLKNSVTDAEYNQRSIQSSRDILGALVRIRLVGSPPVVQAADNLLHETTADGPGADAGMHQAMTEYLEACRQDLAYDKSPWKPWHWWAIRQHRRRLQAQSARTAALPAPRS